jgi:hypothetical protein
MYYTREVMRMGGNGSIRQTNKLSDIDPDAEYIDPDVIYPEGAHIPNQCYINYGRDLDGCSSQENGGCRSCILYRNKTD